MPKYAENLIKNQFTCLACLKLHNLLMPDRHNSQNYYFGGKGPKN